MLDANLKLWWILPEASGWCWSKWSMKYYGFHLRWTTGSVFREFFGNLQQSESGVFRNSSVSVSKKRDWRPRETGDFTNAFFFSARKRWDSQPTSHWILGFWSLELGDVRNWWSKKSRIHGFYMVFPTKTAHGLVDWLENLDCKPWLRTMGTGFLQMFPSITSTKVGILKIHPFKALKQWL